MLRTEDFIRDFPVVKKTDRDCELVLLKEYVESKTPIESLLDVGSHFSTYNGYAPMLRKHAKLYDGIDIIDDTDASIILDHFFVGNAITYPLEQYDMVACISTIEHAGVSTYKREDIQGEQNALFKRCLELTKKYMWISFPTGLPYIYPNELSIITEDQLTLWEKMVKDAGFKLKERFLHNQSGPQFNSPWREHKKREASCKQMYWDYCGNMSITVMEIEK